MKVYITKYWLTKGIIEKEGDIVYKDSLFKSNNSRYAEYFHKNQFFLTMEEAKKHCEVLRFKKIKILEGQIKKIEEIKF